MIIDYRDSNHDNKKGKNASEINSRRRISILIKRMRIIIKCFHLPSQTSAKNLAPCLFSEKKISFKSYRHFCELNIRQQKKNNSYFFSSISGSCNLSFKALICLFVTKLIPEFFNESNDAAIEVVNFPLAFFLSWLFPLRARRALWLNF